MNALFEPTLLFITDEAWHNEETRDDFLNHLFEHLELIDKFDICKILWTDEFDILMFETPRLNPWQQSYWSRHQIIPIIYKILNNRKNYEAFCDMDICSITPPLKHEITQHDAQEKFLQLAHTLIQFEETFYPCVGLKNQLERLAKYTFSCNCHQKEYTPHLINTANDWLYHIDVVAKFFPKTIEEFDEKFGLGMEVIQRRDFENKPYLFGYEFTKNFKKSIIKRTTQQEAIFIAVVKKLISTASEAASSDLKDEFIGKTKEWRIRVTQRPSSTRIHYQLETQTIKFLQYYGEGEHDKAL